jgi:ferrous iron transport protein A
MILDIICAKIVSFPHFLLCCMYINELEPGDKVRLMDFGATNPQYRRRLLSLGITRGVAFSVVRIAPLGCPVQIEVRGTSLTLRKEEASHLVLERI